MALLGGVALIGFAAFYLIDHYVTGGGPAEAGASAIGRYVRPEPSLISDALSGLTGINAAVLGIVITVVSLLVQLTSDRYTGVARMFLRDRTNVAVMAYYVIACVVGLFLSLSLHSEFVPRATVFAMLAATGFGLVIMLPYFAYVFDFLDPEKIVGRITANGLYACTPIRGKAAISIGAR